MGQRLNISIERDGEVIANAYYHWSAYTSSAASLAQDICGKYAWMRKNTKSDLELAVRLLQSTGAGLASDERMRVERDTTGRYEGLEFRDAADRHRGLLSVTPEGIAETEDWEEGRVTFDLANDTVDFSVYWEMPLDEYKEDYLDEDEPLPPEHHYSFEPLKVDAFYGLVELIEKFPNGFVDGDTVYQWIE